MTQPWNTPNPPGTPSADASSADWQAYTQAHHRWWSEWMDAGRLWLSWWYSTLPPMPWPPTGAVLPPQEAQPGNVVAEPVQPSRHPVEATMPPPKSVTPRARAQSARHH